MDNFNYSVKYLIHIHLYYKYVAKVKSSLHLMHYRVCIRYKNNLETLIVLVEITVFMYVHDLDCMQEGDGSPVRFQSTCHNSRYTKDILVIWSE